MAGFYTHICLWTAFATWLITVILFFVVIPYAAFFLGLTGSIMVLGNIIYGTLRWGPDLVIPFNSHAKLEPKYGWCFYLSLLTGLACIILAVVIYVIDLYRPNATASFFNIDILASFEDEVLVKSAPGEEDQNEANGDTHEMKPVEGNANGDSRPEDPNGHYRNVEIQIKFRPRTRTGLLTRRNPRAPKPAPRNQAASVPDDDDDDNFYANVPRRGVTVKVTNPQYVEKPVGDL